MSVSEQITNASNDVATAHKLVRRLISLKCWYVSAGGPVGTTFQLALGEKIPRDVPLQNENHLPDYQKNEGEANLLVWCDWRLDGEEKPITSCDDDQNRVAAGLERLTGQKIAVATLFSPGWDLHLEFAGGLTLKIFADHLPGDPSFDGNWDLFLPDFGLYAGPGAKLEIKPR